ncbi:MAG: hypothetical protein M1836_007875 [Candelina mexicana]|nr:MAG: hypothetical protein M1836_007875 [Candelina mexicana]
MVTRTILSDASMVIIDIGKTVLPWLQETTYLLDPADGRTTRTQAQTVMPTPGVTESNIIHPAGKIQLSGSFIITVITEATGVRTSVIGTTSIVDPDDPIPSEFFSLTSSSSPPVNSAASSTISTTRATPPAASTSTTSSTGSSAPPTVTIVMGLAGGVFCLLLLGISYYFYRRSRRRRSSERDSLESDDTLLASSPSTPSSLEKGKEASYFEKAVPDLMRSYIHKFRKAGVDDEKVSTNAGSDQHTGGYDAPNAGSDSMRKEVGATTQQTEESTTSSEYGSHAGEGSSEGGYHETESVMEERLYRLRNRNHSPPPLPPPSAGRDIPVLPALPPLPTQTGDEVQELRLNRLPRAPESSPGQESSSPPNSSDPTKSTPPSSPPTSGTLVNSLSPVSARRLTSILKAPPPSTALFPTLTPDFKKWVDTVQERFGKGPGPRYEPTFAEPAVAPKKKKGVTFGFEEVREFGDTPRGSLDLDEDDELGPREQRGDGVEGDQESGTSSELGHEAEGLALKRAKEEEASGVRKSWFLR